jgi:hypothetical protein
LGEQQNQTKKATSKHMHKRIISNPPLPANQNVAVQIYVRTVL